MADHFRLAEPGQTDRRFARQAAQMSVADFDVRQIDAGDAGAAEFEDQAFFMVKAAVARNGRQVVGHDRVRRDDAAAVGFEFHYSTSFSAASKTAKSSSVLVSVTATINR